MAKKPGTPKQNLVNLKPMKHKMIGFALPAPRMFKNSFYWKATTTVKKSEPEASTSGNRNPSPPVENPVEDSHGLTENPPEEVESSRIKIPADDFANKMSKYEELVNIWREKAGKRLHNLLTKSPGQFADTISSEFSVDESITPKTVLSSNSWLKNLPPEEMDASSFNLDTQLLSQIIRNKTEEKVVKENQLPDVRIDGEFSDFWSNPPCTPILKTLESNHPDQNTSVSFSDLNIENNSALTLGLNLGDNENFKTFWGFRKPEESKRTMFW
ncbi:hypothetical protein DMENIID0001_081340 [Sergentomyia squamirostris]